MEDKLVRVAMYCDEAFRTEFKVVCAQNQTSMNEVMLELVTEWIKRNRE